MSKKLIIGLLCLISFTGSSQKLLVVENIKSLKNIKYYQGDGIILKVENNKSKMVDAIFDMTDSTIILYDAGEVALNDITGIYRENRIIQILRTFSWAAGAAYFALDSFNRLINNDSPVILAETVAISAGLVAFSFALAPLTYRKFNTRGNWSLRTIDLNAF